MLKKNLKLLPEIVTRITLASVFIESGWGKLHGLDKVTAYFESLHIPFAHLQAPFVAGIELLAGIAIGIGFFTRFASFLLVGIMVVAIRTAKWEDITDWSSLNGTSEFLYLVLLLWLVAWGSRGLSVDILVKMRGWKTAKSKS